MRNHVPLKAAARRLGISYHRLRRWIIKGLVRARQIPPGRYGRWWIPEEELRRLEAMICGAGGGGQS